MSSSNVSSINQNTTSSPAINPLSRLNQRLRNTTSSIKTNLMDTINSCSIVSDSIQYILLFSVIIQIIIIIFFIMGKTTFSIVMSVAQLLLCMYGTYLIFNSSCFKYSDDLDNVNLITSDL